MIRHGDVVLVAWQAILAEKASGKHPDTLTGEAKLRINRRMTITPAMARLWLMTLGKNRKLRPHHAMIIADEIERGKWHYNGASIRFSESGKLIDGQHRLLAAVLANTAIDSEVVFNIPDAAFDTIDQVARPRSPADLLALAGYSWPTGVVAAARLIYTYNNRQTTYSLTQRGSNLTASDILDYVTRDPAIAKAVATTHGSMHVLERLCTPSIATLVYYETTRLSPARGTRFCEMLRTGIGLQTGNPILPLRERLILEAPARTLSLGETLALIIMTWNAWINYETRTKTPAIDKSRTYPHFQLPRAETAQKAAVKPVERLRLHTQETPR